MVSKPEPKTNHFRNWAFLIVLVLFLLAVDQVTKWLVVQNLAVNEAWAPIPALSKIFTITHVRNTGVAFGQIRGWGWLFMLVNIGVTIGILVYYPRIPKGQWKLRLASALIMAGALGNVITRLLSAFEISKVIGSLWTALPMAYVTDFMDFQIWPVWNMADLCIVSGTALLAWTLWQSEKEATANEAMAKESVAGE